MQEFNELQKALEQKITAALNKIAQYAQQKNLADVSEECDFLLHPSEMASITISYDDLGGYEDIMDATSPGKDCFECLDDNDLRTFIFDYEFVLERMGSGLSMTVSGGDSLILRLAILLSNLENCSWPKSTIESEDPNWIANLVADLREYLEIWNSVYKGVTPKHDGYGEYGEYEGESQIDLEPLESAMIRLLEMPGNVRQRGALATKDKGKSTERMILKEAGWRDPKKKMSAHALSIELEEFFKHRRKTTVRTLSDGSKIRKDTSSRPKGFKKSNIRRILIKNGWIHSTSKASP
jgi:hypothetical protein